VLAVLLFGNVFAEFTLWSEKAAIYNLEGFIVFGLGQRALPQIILKQIR
jgi:hypothetical protein